MGRIRQETLSGVKWGLIQKCTMQPVQFLFGIALARLISPREFGILGLTAVFFAVANALRDAGFGSALIRKQDRTEEDCSTMFWFNLGMSCLMGGILFLLAPWFAEFFHEPDLVWLTRISALMMCVTCTASVHWTLYTARRDFKTPAIVGMIITLIGMPICLYFAFNGWGIWALVIQQVTTSLLSLIVIWIISPWKPKFVWSNKSFVELFSFGARLSLSGLITTLYNEMRSFFIGKFYSAADLGLYNKGSSLCKTSAHLLTSVLDSVSFPILSTLQNDPSRLTQVYKTYIRVASAPMHFFLCLAAFNCTNIIYILYGETWVASAIFAQILCICHMLNPIIIMNNKIMLILGRSDIVLKQEVIIRCWGVPALCIGAYISIVGICYTAVSTALFATIISTRAAARLSGMRQREIYACSVPYLLLSIIANLPACFLSNFISDPWLALLINIVLAILIYTGLLTRKKDSAWLIYTDIIKERIRRYKENKVSS